MTTETYIHEFGSLPHPGDFGIPKGHWWQAKAYADQICASIPKCEWVDMTTLEQAARMSLDALQLCANGEDDTMLTRDALANLRQALEQPTVKDCLTVEQKQKPR